MQTFVYNILFNIYISLFLGGVVVSMLLRTSRDFFPQSKDMYCRLINISNLFAACELVADFVNIGLVPVQDVPSVLLLTLGRITVKKIDG